MTGPTTAVARPTNREPLLARRIFVSAALVLLANDWLLKGSGVAPSWLTGKLSDVAGMLVAPAVLAAMLALARVPVAAARTLAALAIAVAFGALKLDSGLAARFDGATNNVVGHLSLPVVARTVPDPTDLVVLPLLVVGAWLAGRLARDRAFHRSGALVVGVLACAATSPSQVRLQPHWGFATPGPSRMWGTRLAAGAVVVQLGRQSSDGAFEIGIELAAREGDLALDARETILDLPTERSIAQIPAGQPATVRVRRGETRSLRYVFRPRTTAWAKGTPGALQLGITDGDRPRIVRVPLSFDERIVSWHERPALR